MANERERREFSFSKLALHLALALGILALTSVVMWAIFEPEDPAAIAWNTTWLLLPCLAPAVFSSYLIQTRRHGYALVFGVLTVAMLIGAVVMPVAKSLRMEPLPMGDVEREPLEVIDIGGLPHLRHPYLGFSFAQPTGFERSVEVEAALQSAIPGRPGKHFYALARPDGDDSMLVVVVEKWTRVDRDAVSRVVDELSRLGSDGQRRTLERHVSWEPSFRGAHLHSVLGDADHLRLGVWVDSFGVKDAEWIVAVVGLSLGDDRFAPVVPSFRYR